MQISEVASATDFSADTLRYYERIHLLPYVARDASGRRSYSNKDLARLAFIRRAQHMQFSLDEIKALLQLRERGGRARPEALKLAQQKLAVIERTLEEVQELHAELKVLVSLCSDASDDACPILEKLDKRC